MGLKQKFQNEPQYTHVRNTGDVNPFDYGGVVVLQGAVEDLVLIRIDNLQDHVGPRECPNPNKILVDVYYCDQSYLKNNYDELFERSGLPSLQFEQMDLVDLAVEAMYLGLGYPYYTRDQTREFETRYEAMKFIFNWWSGQALGEYPTCVEIAFYCGLQHDYEMLDFLQGGFEEESD